jgi:tripartite-type tricarboxylate transporter receptor subunit TctC
VPSISEAGVKGYDATFWYGLLAPAGTPPAIVNKLNQHLRAVLSDPETIKPVQGQGLNPSPSSPQEYTARIKADYEKWRKVLAAAQAH